MGKYLIPRKMYGIYGMVYMLSVIYNINPLSNFGGGVLLWTDRQVSIMHSFHIPHIQRA